jgi:hypothetical protein
MTLSEVVQLASMTDGRIRRSSNGHVMRLEGDEEIFKFTWEDLVANDWECATNKAREWRVCALGLEPVATSFRESNEGRPPLQSHGYHAGRQCQPIRVREVIE